MWRALCEVHQRPALHINEGLLPRRVHHLQHVRARIACPEVKIVVVLAGKSLRRGLQPVEFACHANGFRLGHRLSYARLQQHASNLIRIAARASIPDGRRLAPPPFRAAFSPLTTSLYPATTLERILVHSPWIAGSSPACCHTPCAGIPRPTSCVHCRKCSPGSSSARSSAIRPLNSIDSRLSPASSPARSAHQPSTPC